MAEQQGEEELELIKCLICHSEMLDRISITRCGHRFCTECISRWYRLKAECPTCRCVASESQLVPDRALPELIKLYKDQRVLLQTAGAMNRELETKLKSETAQKNCLREHERKVTSLLNDKIKSLDTALGQETESKTSLTGELQAARARIEELEAENTKYQQQLPSAFQKIQDLTVTLEQTRLQTMLVSNRCQELEFYEHTCAENSQALFEMRNSIIPHKDQTICDLQKQVLKLSEEMASLRNDTIPLQDHAEQLQSALQTTIDNIQKSYESARDRNHENDVEHRKIWQQRLTDLQTKLAETNEDRNEFSTLTPTFKNLVKENVELQQTLDIMKDQLRQSQDRSADE